MKYKVYGIVSFCLAFVVIASSLWFTRSEKKERYHQHLMAEPKPPALILTIFFAPISLLFRLIPMVLLFPEGYIMRTIPIPPLQRTAKPKLYVTFNLSIIKKQIIIRQIVPQLKVRRISTSEADRQEPLIKAVMKYVSSPNKVITIRNHLSIWIHITNGCFTDLSSIKHL